jgi:hypothetical protein
MACVVNNTENSLETALYLNGAYSRLSLGGGECKWFEV